MKQSKVFLSHTSADKPVVRRFAQALKNFDDVVVWFDEDNVVAGNDLITKVTREVKKSNYVIFFWSKNAKKRYSSKAVGNLSWIGAELRIALQIGVKNKRQFIVVLLDETPQHADFATFSFAKNIKAMGLLGGFIDESDAIIWRACIEIVAGLRGVPPLFPTLELLQENGRPVEKNLMHYFAHTWVDGYCPAKQRSGDEYIDILQNQTPNGKRAVGGKVPAMRNKDGILSYCFFIPDHIEGGFWTAAISFDLADTTWRHVDLTKYRELRFNGYADKNGLPICVSFTDNDVGTDTPSGHQETSATVFKLGTWWKPGGYVVKLAEIDWSINGHSENKRDVNRAKVLQIVFNNFRLPWEPGPREVKVGYIVLL